MKHEMEIVAIKTPTQDGLIEVSTPVLEEYFNVSRKTLAEWEKKGCPKLGRGKWDLISVLKWRGGLAPLNNESEDNEDAYLRKIKADAFLKEQQGQIAEIELQKLRMQVIEISEVEHLIGGVIMNTKGLLQALPSKAAPKLLGLSSLDDLKTVFMDYRTNLVKTKTSNEYQDVVQEIMSEFCEAKSIVEINIILSTLIHEALEELADLNLEQFGGDDCDNEIQAAGRSTITAVETSSSD